MHRNLKPENILVDLEHEGEVKAFVSDFAYARVCLLLICNHTHLKTQRIGIVREERLGDYFTEHLN